MKALSLKQPWLYCMTHLGKRVENRTWKMPKKMEGKWVALHASKKPEDRYIWEDAENIACQDIHSRDVVLGSVVAIAVFSRCVNRKFGVPDRQKRWFFGPWGWLCHDLIRLPDPQPATGSLGFWQLPPSIEYYCEQFTKPIEIPQPEGPIQLELWSKK